MRWTSGTVAAVVAGALSLGAPAPSTARATTTYLGCGSRSGWTVGARPRDCFLDWPDLPLARAVSLHHVAWNSWGDASARGRALVRTKVYDPWTHVRVRAFARRSCGRLHVYTKVSVDFGSSSHTWRTPGCAYVHVDD
jgi:hypothetical protein